MLIFRFIISVWVTTRISLHTLMLKFPHTVSVTLSFKVLSL